MAHLAGLTAALSSVAPSVPQEDLHAEQAGAWSCGMAACGGIHSELASGISRQQHQHPCMSYVQPSSAARNTGLYQGRHASLRLLCFDDHLRCSTRIADLRSCSHLCRDDHLSGSSFTSCCDKQLSGATVPHSRAYCKCCSTPRKRLHTSGRQQMPVLW